MSKVAIVTDSNSGITQGEAKEYGVTVMPMPFFINDQTYYEDIDLTQEDFYQKLSEDANISTSMPLVGNVTEPRMIQIQPWEASMVKEIEKVIMTSDLGINPTNDGKTIRLLFPELTEERRKDLAKDVKKKGESAKVAIRNIRRDANDSFKKLAKEDVSEDEIKALEENAQKMTDKYIAAVDEAVEVKTKEILTV